MVLSIAPVVVFAEDTYTVTFDSNHGSAIRNAAVEVAAGATVAEPTDNIKRIGYTFDGWYLNDAPFDFTSAINADTTLVAHWTKDASFFDASTDEVRIAGQIDVLGADIRSNKDYSAELTLYRGYEGFSSADIAGISVGAKIYDGDQLIDTKIATFDVGNVTLADMGLYTDVGYDAIANLLEGVLANIAKSTWTIACGEASATYTVAYDGSEYGYKTLTATPDSGEAVRAVMEAIMNSDNFTKGTIEGGLEFSLFVPEGSYIKCGGEAQRIKSDVTAPMMDVNGEFDGDLFKTSFYHVLGMPEDASDEGDAVLYLKAGTCLTLGATSATLDKDMKVIINGLGTNGLLSKLAGHEGEVSLDDINALCSIIPTSASAITATFEFGDDLVEPDLDTTSEAFVIHNGEKIYAGAFADIIKTSGNPSGIASGDTIKLNSKYEGDKTIARSAAFGSTYPNNATELTLDLNGWTLTCSATQTISVGVGKTLNIINSSDDTASLINSKESTGIAIRAGGGTVNVDGDIVVSGAIALASQGNAAAQLNVTSGSFNGLIKQDKGTITITGGTYTVDPTDYLAEGYAAVEDEGVYTVHEINYANPIVTWGPVDGDYKATFTYQCADCGEDVAEEYVTPDFSKFKGVVTYTAEDTHGNPAANTIVETYTVAYNDEVQAASYHWGDKCTLTADAKSDWYIGDTIVASAVASYTFPVVDNTVIRSVALEEDKEPEAVISATFTSDAPGKAVFNAKWSIPAGSDIISVKTYRAMTKAANTYEAEQFMGLVSANELGMRGLNGDYTLRLSNLKAARYQHMLLVIEYRTAAGAVETINTGVLRVYP